MNKNEFKKIIEKHYSGNPNIYGFKVIEQEGCYVAKLDCGIFQQFVVIDPETDYRQYDTVALGFKVNGLKYTFSIYDLFAFFEIDNYNVYTFETILNEVILNDILDIFDSVVNDCYSLLKSLSNDDCLKDKLSKMLVDDLHLDTIEDEPDFEQIKREELAELTKPCNCAYSGFIYPMKNDGKRSKQKIIKELEKYEDKLDTYEKRALAYLKSCNEMPKPFIEPNKASPRKYHMIMLGITFLISIIPALAFVIRNFVVFSDGYVPSERFGLKTGITIACVFVLFIAVSILFGAVILKLITPNDIREITIKRFEESLYEKLTASKGKLSLIVRRIEKAIFKTVMVAVILFSLVTMMVANEGIAFYDGYVKLINMVDIVTVEYQDLKIYAVEGELDENENFVNDEDDYVIIGSDYNYIQIPDVETNSETEKIIKRKATQYNIEIKNVKIFEDIKELK